MSRPELSPRTERYTGPHKHEGPQAQTQTAERGLAHFRDAKRYSAIGSCSLAGWHCLLGLRYLCGFFLQTGLHRLAGRHYCADSLAIGYVEDILLMMQRLNR